MRPNGFLRLLCGALLALGAVAGLYHLIAQAWLLFGGASSGDAQYYWTVGRGLLNGLTLYTEIFDTKPPAIYLLSALSLWLFDDAVLGYWLNALVILVIPLSFGIATWHMCHDRERDQRVLCITAGVLFGACIALFAVYHAEGWQVEWYGGFFGTLYVLLLGSSLTAKRMHIALLSLCMFAAIGFKEPFFLSLLSAALVLTVNRREFFRSFLLPVGIVAAVGIVALLVLGYAEGYFTVYLPSHFGHHLVRSTPLWQRGLWADLLVLNIGQFSTIFLGLLTVLFVAALLRFSRSPGRILLILFAFYLAILAGSLRGYPVASHFVAAIPFYVALFLSMLRDAIGGWASDRSPKFLVATAALSALTLVLLPLEDESRFTQKLHEQNVSEAQNRVAAEAIDTILDACGIDRYYFVEQKPYMPYTKHSPLNFFVYIGPEATVYYHPIIIKKQLDSLSAAQIIIAHGNAYEISERKDERLVAENVFAYLARHFTITPRPCAAGLPLPEGYSVLYRKDPNDTAPFPYRLK